MGGWNHLRIENVRGTRKDMDKHSHVGLISAIPHALLLGILVFPATVLSQVDTNDAEFTAPVQQQPNQYETDAYGMPPGDFTRKTAPVFTGQPGYHGPRHGPGAGYGTHDGMSPFDKADMPPKQAPQGGYVGAGSSRGAPMPMHPMRGMPGYGTMEPGKAANMPYATQGRHSCAKGGMRGCAHNPFMKGSGMGMGGLWQLSQIPDLSKEQRKKINDISDEIRRSHWALMGEKMEHSTQLRRLYEAEPLDAKAIGETYAKIFNIKRKLIQGNIEANQKAKEVLTDEQRKQLQSWRR
uniref:LTXXQ motif family protein n=1 Tax=Candidatus Kentrum sp. UNK TaxID=2126344 RepID=A0A451B650_9GAMM|nr:MAG: LTXXQ motif family protein [Candidatus Kentron sp. UNK]VFK73752.1 MAG: LTXXQ motif family protein [Candidatus Kentron sp. UNK]